MVDERNQAWDFSGRGAPRLVRPGDTPLGSGEETHVATASRFDGARTRTGGPVGAPVAWLLAAAACVVTSLGFGASGTSRPAFWLTGWVVGGFACVGFLATFTLVDSSRRTDPWFVARPAVYRIRTVLVFLAAFAVALNSWRFADWVSRR
jgi:hypothetical protein